MNECIKQTYVTLFWWYKKKKYNAKYDTKYDTNNTDINDDDSYHCFCALFILYSRFIIDDNSGAWWKNISSSDA